MDVGVSGAEQDYDVNQPSLIDLGEVLPLTEDESKPHKVDDQKSMQPVGAEVPVLHSSEVVIIDEDSAEDETELDVPYVSRPRGFVKRWAVKIVSWVKRFFGQ